MSADRATPRPPPTEGTPCREKWNYEVEDESQVPREYLKVDHGKLEKYAEAMRDQAKIPGVRFFAQPVVPAHTRHGYGRGAI